MTDIKRKIDVDVEGDTGLFIIEALKELATNGIGCW
jgi:hypothetical protein